MTQDRVMNREFDHDEITIDLTELFLFLLSKLQIIVLAGIFVALSAFVGTKLFVTPMYTSVTKMYVIAKQDSTASVTYTDLQTGSQLTKDYVELAKSRPVLEQVVTSLGLDMEPEQLEAMITVDESEDTRVFSVVVSSPNPREAKEIADAVREFLSVQITEIMDADAVNTVEQGNLPTSPSSPNINRNVAIGFALGLLMACGVIVLIFMLDDTIKTPDDVERYLGLNTLTSIPIEEGEKKPKKIKKKMLKQRKPTAKNAGGSARK